MRQEYRKQIELKQAEKTKPVDYLLIKKVNNKKANTRNVKINYLSEIPSIEYSKRSEEKKSYSETTAAGAADSSSLVLYDNSEVKKSHHGREI